jgi:hypothetical protein
MSSTDNKTAIFLNISEIAAFVGQNKWDYITPFERLWKKYDPEYKICLDEYNNLISTRKTDLILLDNEKRIIEQNLEDKKITKRQYTKLIKEVESKSIKVTNDIDNLTSKVNSISLTQSEKIEKDLGKDIIQTISSSSKETQDKRKITNEAIDKLEKQGKIKKEQKDELLKQTESLINKTHGTLKEDSAIKIFENNYNITLDTSQKYYKYKIIKTEKYNWFIGGKMDGIFTDLDNPENNYVVEVKNRTKGFFNSLREYEKTQIQLYLLLTGFKNSKLVEKYNSKIRVTDVPVEQQYIDDILEYLLIFINKTITFWENNKLKMSYLDMTENEKKKFLNKLYLDDIAKLQKHKEEVKIIEHQADDECLLSDLDDF